MSAAETLPQYLLRLSPDERGNSVNISLSDYRHLARTGLSITKDVPGSFMAVYRTEGGCILDLFLRHHCLSIQVSSRSHEVSLFAAGLDSAEAAVCLFAGSNCPEDWRALQNCALTLSR
jgi:hypothetical protein